MPPSTEESVPHTGFGWAVFELDIGSLGKVGCAVGCAASSRIPPTSLLEGLVVAALADDVVDRPGISQQRDCLAKAWLA